MNSDRIRGDPLFFVHSLDGSVDSLFDLAQNMDRPVFGLQRTLDMPLNAIEDLAGAYISVSSFNVRD